MTCRSVDKTNIEIDTETVNTFVSLKIAIIKLEYLAVGRDVGRLVGWTDGTNDGFFVGTKVGVFGLGVGAFVITAVTSDGFIDSTGTATGAATGVVDVTEWIPQRQRTKMAGCHMFIDVFIFVFTVCNRNSQRIRSQSYGRS